MRKSVVTLAAVALTAGAAIPASADPDDVTGFLCTYTALGVPEDPGAYVGEIDGGPLTVIDLPDSVDVTRNPMTLMLTCTLQSGWGTTHEEADLVSVSGSGTVAATIPPTPVSYRVDPWKEVSLCTEVTVTDAHGQVEHLYYDDAWDEFSTDPGVKCAPPPPCAAAQKCSPYDWSFVDAVVCPILALFLPPQGDVADLWDCPPYGS